MLLQSENGIVSFHFHHDAAQLSGSQMFKVLSFTATRFIHINPAVIGTYVIYEAAMIKNGTKSHIFGAHSEHERLLLLQRQQFSQEETPKQMEVATLMNAIVFHALHDQIGIRSALQLCNWKLPNYHQ